MGLLSGVKSAANGAYQTVAGVADHSLGSADEAAGRQFDSTPGGGFLAGFGEELGSSRPSFLTGAGQYLGVVPRGTQEQREEAAGPGVQEEGTPVWGGGEVQDDGTVSAPEGLGANNAILLVMAVVLLYLIRPLLGAVDNLTEE